MNLKNVPALAAVAYLAQSHGMTVQHGLDILVLRPTTSLDEDAWRTEMMTLSEKVIAAFNLPPGQDGDKAVNSGLQKKLKDYGVRFDFKFEVRWYGRQLYVRNTPEEITRMKGLFMLIDSGHLPQKAAK
jgi:hypothetical protein